MRTRLIGVGAAGNKAAISAIVNGIVDEEDVLLVNSTLKDIPKDFNGKKFCFTNSYGGCGKERKLANELTYDALKSGDIKLDEFLKVGESDVAELVILVSSTEGGTGSGSVPVLARYIKDALDIEVHCFGFLGFEDDGRGLMNTISYLQEMQDNFCIDLIQNTKYLPLCNNNKFKSEKMANEDFCKKVGILLGNLLRDSDHNIDATDLFKIATTPGYTFIESVEFDKIKNREQFREMVTSLIDNSKSLDLDEPSQTRLAVMINIDESSTDYIDYADILADRFGTWFEKYEHIQHETDMPGFFAFISAGSKIPVKEVESIFDRYKQTTAKVVKSKDDFFNKKFEFEDDDSFDVGNLKSKSIKANKDAFFGKEKEDKSIKANDEDLGRYLY